MAEGRSGPFATPFAVTRTAIVVAAAAALLWLVAVQGVAQSAARSSNPALLGLFDPARHPDAGERLARLFLLANQPERALPLARDAAIADPMNVSAMRSLALALQAGDETAAEPVFRIAERLSRRNTAVSLWAIQDAVAQRDARRVMEQVDILARRNARPEITSQLLYAGLLDAPSREVLVERLRLDPPWRPDFFSHANANLPPSAFANMEALLDLMAATDAPPTEAERLLVIDRMVRGGAFDRAKAYWTRAFGIDGAESIPFDPAFSRAVDPDERGGSSFEWQRSAGSDRYASFVETTDGAVLRIDPGAQDNSILVTQAIGLPPGEHEIETRLAYGMADRAPVGWMVECIGTGRRLVRRFARQGDELNGVRVTVPADCPAQWLQLVSRDQFETRPVQIERVAIR